MLEKQESDSGLGRDNQSSTEDAGKEATGGFLDDLNNETGSGGDAASQQTAQGNDAGQDQSGAKATSELPKFATAIPKETRADPKVVAFLSKFKSWDELTKAAVELESKLGKAGSNEKVNVPEKPEDYNLGDIGEDQVTIDQAARFRTVAHKLGLSQDQAQSMWRDGRAALGGILGDAAARNTEEKGKLVEKLKGEWGNSYEVNRKVMGRGLMLAGDAFLQDLKKAGLANSYGVAMHLYKLGRLLGEDAGGNKGPSAPEFKPGIDRPGI